MLESNGPEKDFGESKLRELIEMFKIPLPTSSPSGQTETRAPYFNDKIFIKSISEIWGRYLEDKLSKNDKFDYYAFLFSVYVSRTMNPKGLDKDKLNHYQHRKNMCKNIINSFELDESIDD